MRRLERPEVAWRLSSAIVCVTLGFTIACGRSETTSSTPPPASSSAAPAPPKTPDVGLYVTNETSGDLTIIDAATLTPRWPSADLEPCFNCPSRPVGDRYRNWGLS
jgi:hypothetical protein